MPYHKTLGDLLQPELKNVTVLLDTKDCHVKSVLQVFTEDLGRVQTPLLVNVWNVLATAMRRAAQQKIMEGFSVFVRRVGQDHTVTPEVGDK